MTFEFALEDGSKAFVDDDGAIFITGAGDDPIDIEAERAAMALGFEPSAGYELWGLWKSILEALEENNELDGMLREIAATGEIRTRWRGAWVGEQSYIYEFDTDELLEYLGPLLKKWIVEDTSEASELARLIKALRKKDGTAYEFSLNDSGFDEETNPETFRLWSALERTLSADEIDLVTWTEDYEREIYDPINFESETDPDREPWRDFASSSELPLVIKALGLSERLEELESEANENAPGPYHPDAQEGGEYGVWHEYCDYRHDPNTGEDVQFVKIEVVPYGFESDADDAVHIGTSVIEWRDGIIDPDVRCGEEKYLYNLHWVRLDKVIRLPDHIIEWLKREREAAIREQNFLLKQKRLFDGDEEIELIEPWNPELDVWATPEDFEQLEEDYEDMMEGLGDE